LPQYQTRSNGSGSLVILAAIRHGVHFIGGGVFGGK
jgi:hypothetical protein